MELHPKLPTSCDADITTVAKIASPLVKQTKPKETELHDVGCSLAHIRSSCLIRRNPVDPFIVNRSQRRALSAEACSGFLDLTNRLERS